MARSIVDHPLLSPEASRRGPAAVAELTREGERLLSVADWNPAATEDEPVIRLALVHQVNYRAAQDPKAHHVSREVHGARTKEHRAPGGLVAPEALELLAGVEDWPGHDATDPDEEGWSILETLRTPALRRPLPPGWPLDVPAPSAD